MLNRRVVLGSAVLLGSLLMSQAVYAAPREDRSAVVTKSAKVKLVKFALRNDTKSAMSVKAGETMLTLAPGKATDVKLAVGTTIVAQDGGAVLATVSAALSDSTVVLN